MRHITTLTLVALLSECPSVGVEDSQVRAPSAWEQPPGDQFSSASTEDYAFYSNPMMREDQLSISRLECSVYETCWRSLVTSGSSSYDDQHVRTFRLMCEYSNDLPVCQEILP